MESKINLNLKKIFIVVTTVVLIIVNMNLTNINAVTAVTGNIKHSDWWLADPSTGRRDEHEAELTINGETAYCVDAFTVFKSGVTMPQGSFTDIGISRDIAKQLSLIVYFGTKVDGRTGKDWYAITQGLVWKTIHEAQGQSDMCYVETPTNPDYPTTLRLWNEILKDIEDYKREPSFVNAIYEVDADSTITLTDTNNALKNTIITNTGGLDDMQRPKAKLIGENGNIFNLMGIASNTLNNSGFNVQAKEIVDRIRNSKSYDEALGIIWQYVEPVGEEHELNEENSLQMEGY